MERVEIVFVDVAAAEESAVYSRWRVGATASSRERSGRIRRCAAVLGRNGDGMCAANMVGLEIRRRGMLVGYCCDFCFA